MADTFIRDYYISRSRYLCGLLAVSALFLLGATCLITLARHGLSLDSFLSLWHDSYLFHVVLITVKQSLLSVFFASLIGVGGALAFHRRHRFIGRSAILIGCFSAMIMPSTVAALSLLKLWGQSGFVAQTPFAIFVPDRLGLWSVVLAHVFFNAPLVMRVCLTALDNASISQRRVATLLGFSPWRYFMILDLPVIKQVLPSIMGLVFLLCATSFSLVLMLGGGPAITTLEVSIYTALRFDFNLAQAAYLSLIQLILCALLLRLFRKKAEGVTSLSLESRLPVIRADAMLPYMRCFDFAMITAIIILNILPLVILVSQASIMPGLALLYTERFWSAFSNSIMLAVGAALFALIVAFLLGFLAHEAQLRKQHKLLGLIELSHSLFLVIPALVLGTALFILLRSYGDVTVYGFWILMLGNGLLALPFCHRIIAPALIQHLNDTDRLVAQLALPQWRRITVIILPSLRHEIGFALGLSAALSFGDLGIITLFGSQSFETLPYMLFSYVNRYGAEEADLLSLILLVSSIGLYRLFLSAVRFWGAQYGKSVTC